MTAGQIGFFVIIALLVLGIAATIIASWWRGRKEK
jgi:type II secretory pathway pseudopilin PulG